MAITKPSRSMLSTGISDSSDATFLTADSSENATFAGNLTVSGNLTVTGTTTQVDTVTMNAQNAVLFEGATADAHETTLTTVDPTGDRTISLPNVSGTLPVLAAASVTQISSTPEELNLLDGSSANSVVNSKAVIYGSGGELAGTLSTAAQTNITSVGTLTALAGGTGDLVWDTTTLVVDSSANFVGMGTASPSAALDVVTDNNVWTGEFTQSNTSNGDGILVQVGSTAAADYALSVRSDAGNTHVLAAKANGNVGIGEASPSATLHINTSTNSPLIVESTHGDGGYIELQLSDNSSAGELTGYIGSSEALISGGAAADLAIRAQGKFEVSTGGNSKRMSIFTDGSGQFYGSWSLEDNKKLQLGASADLQIWHDGSDSYIRDDGTGNLLIQSSEMYFGDASGNHRMRLNTGSDPELRLGTTNDYSSTFVAYCDHATDASITAESNTDSFTGEVLVASSTRNTANATYRLIQAQRRGNSVVFTVNDAGNAQNTNNSFTGISDERLKINIEDASSQWDDIKALRVRKYQWGHGNTGHTQIGLVSQEVEAAGMPHLIEESPADEYQIKYNPALEGENVKTMKYSVLYMKAVKALQEAQLRIENLEAENSKLVDLEKRMETIEQRLI